MQIAPAVAVKHLLFLLHCNVGKVDNHWIDRAALKQVCKGQTCRGEEEEEE